MFLTILAFIVITLIDLGPLMRKRQMRDVVAWLIVLVPAITIAVLLLMKVNIPSTMVLVGDAMKAIGLSY